MKAFGVHPNYHPTDPEDQKTQQSQNSNAHSADRDGWDTSHSATKNSKKKKKKTHSGISLAVFDLDTLECLVCLEPLLSQIIQCCNGHYVCQPCIAKMNNKCPTCSEPIGKIRNLGLEKIIESLKIQCEFAHLGCEEMLQYKVKKIHQQNCPKRPRDCPLDGCSFRGHLKEFSLHFKGLHSTRTVNFKYAQWFPVSIEKNDNYLLLKSEEEKLFIFHNKKRVTYWINALYVTELLAAQGDLAAHSYCIVAKDGTNKVQLESHAVPFSDFSVREVECSSNGVLLVPTISIALLKLELYICKLGESISSRG